MKVDAFKDAYKKLKTCSPCLIPLVALLNNSKP